MQLPADALESLLRIEGVAPNRTELENRGYVGVGHDFPAGAPSITQPFRETGGEAESLPIRPQLTDETAKSGTSRR